MTFINEIAAFRARTGTLTIRSRAWFQKVPFHNRRNIDPYNRKPQLSDPQATMRAEDINLVQERILLGLHAFVTDVDDILGQYRFACADFRTAFRSALHDVKAQVKVVMADVDRSLFSTARVPASGDADGTDPEGRVPDFDEDVREDITAFERELRRRVQRLQGQVQTEMDAAWARQRAPFDQALTYADTLAGTLTRIVAVRAAGREDFA